MLSDEQRIEQFKGTFVRDLRTLVRTPSVSSDPSHKEDVRNCAQKLKGLLSWYAEGRADVKIHETAGHPAVLGELKLRDKAPTLMIYNHGDVQPEGADKWSCPPFGGEYDREQGIIYGRGSTDDKGPLLTALVAANMAAEDDLPLNFRFVYEFEEEIGSPHFQEVTDNNPDFFRDVDSVLIADGMWPARDRPAIEHALRGLVYARLELETGDNVHSGIGGGLARNPLLELSDAVVSCADPRTGRVKFEGAYDGIVGTSDEEFAEYVKGFGTVDEFRKLHGLSPNATRTEDAEEAVRRVWIEPTFEVHGYPGGYNVWGGKMTVIPGKAQALVSVRIVNGQDPEAVYRALEVHVRNYNPDIVVKKAAAARAFLQNHNDPRIGFVKQAYKDGFGSDAYLVRTGGTIGAAPTLHDATGSPVIFMPLSLPTDGYHKKNEKFELRQFRGGVKAFLSYFRSVAKAA